MDLLRVAFGLIRDAVGDRVGQEVVNRVRSETSDAPPTVIDIETLLAEQRAHVDRSLQSFVDALKQQNARLEAAVRRQRIWNYSFAAGLVLALLAAIAAVWTGRSL